MKQLLALPFACLVLLNASCADINADPAEAKVITEDLDRFWAAWDAAAAAAGDEAAREQAFDELYRKPATPGLRDFFDVRIGSVRELLAAIDYAPHYYSGLRVHTAKACEAGEAARAAFMKLKELYPDAVFPDVYIVIGRMNSGGTVAKSGLLIGFDMYGANQGATLNELGDWHRSVVQPVDKLHYVIAHELIHYQQEWSSSEPDLLEKVFREGSADFVAELIAGRHINHHIHDWAKGREREIWQHFSARMHESDHNGFLYGGERPEGWPQDVGYYIGYEIARGYYQQAQDKSKALEEILRGQDVDKILELSGYGKNLEGVAG